VNIEMQRCASCHGTRKWHDHFAAHGHECQTFVPTKAVAERARHAALVEAAVSAVESHLMRIVNRTRPMDQAEGLAILAALRAALDGETP
jgi:hypothetical protein